jgi:D-alanyl-D-alanine carboxypeptidase/D-alanyl-D-alanine-endopeptidase (penicillin-binding protein 4)
VELLRIMRDHPEFEVYKDSLPILGVDGSLAYVQTDSPAVGHVFAKTGTTVTLDLTHLRPFVNEKALAGYIEREDGREVAFMVAVENAVIEATIFEDFVPELFEVSDNLAEVSSILWDGLP